MQLIIFFRYLAVTLVVLMASPTQALPEEVVVLGTNVSTKKVDQHPQLVQGGSVDHVKCILNSMQVKHEIRSLPWRRARQDVHSSVIDGFFTAVAVDEASDFATFSAPLVLENWYWFWRSDMAAPGSWKNGFQVGVILGSQQEAILSNEGYSEFVTANNTEQLVKLLFGKRVDVVLMDKEQFENNLKKMNLQPREYKSRFFRYMPLGVYFGAPFLLQHPDFLPAFNARISACSAQGFDLSPSEKESIRKVSEPWFAKIKSNADVVAALIRQNADNREKTTNQLRQIDEQWQLAFKVGNFNYAQVIVNKPVSRLLMQLRASSNDLLSEIIVMDERGYNLAVAEMTSDYWQGDEDKYLQVYSKAPTTFYFDQIKYDASSRRFQVQVSTQILDKSQKPLGVVTLGIDVDKALSLEH